MKKTGLISVMQLFLIVLGFFIFDIVRQGINAFRSANLSSSIYPGIITVVVTFMLLGAVLALHKIFAKGHFKINFIYLPIVIVLIAVLTVKNAMIFTIYPMYFDHFNAVISCAIGFFAIDCFKAYE